MTMTIASTARRPARATGIEDGTRGLPAGTRSTGMEAAPSLGRLGAALLARSGQAQGHARPAGLAAVGGGPIGGAVVTAARRSAGLTRRTLARRLAVTAVTVRSWETGALPLYRVSYDQLGRLAAALSCSPVRLDVADLVLVSQCDLLIAGMLSGFEDYAEVPPLDGDQHTSQAARALLRWALAGDVPRPYLQHARPRPLLRHREAIALAAIARGLAAGTSGPELVSYGAALLALAAR